MKKFLSFALVTFFMFGLVLAVQAAPNIGGMAESIANKAGYDTAGVTEITISKTVGGLIRAILSVIGVIFLVLTVYAGFLWMTAGGNSDSVDKAKKIITSSFIGLVIVAAAYGITALVMAFVFNASAPEGRITPGREDFVDRRFGCCVQGDPAKAGAKCWETVDNTACPFTWYKDEDCGTLFTADSPYYDGVKSCTPQN